MYKKLAQGFTLLEMVTVIVLLGVISVGMGSFIKFGTQIYTDATARDELISSARFAVERLNREIRSALPNSIKIINDAERQCVNFIPTYASAVYRDIPVSPEASSDLIEVIHFDDSNYSDDLFAVPYPLSPDELYQGGDSIPVEINASSRPVDKSVWTIELKDKVQFPNESPTQRIYFVSPPVMYCVDNGDKVNDGKLNRYAKNNFSSSFALSLQAQLMAENIKELDTDNAPPFHIIGATRLRNAILTVELRFVKNDENITFHNEIQVMNVP